MSANVFYPKTRDAVQNHSLHGIDSWSFRPPWQPGETILVLGLLKYLCPRRA